VVLLLVVWMVKQKEVEVLLLVLLLGQLLALSEP
jgi:hypothetical protein